MGADLSVFVEGKEIAYFRDSYNNSNLLWQLGGSYWDMLDKYKSDENKLKYLKECLKRAELKKSEWKDMFKEEWNIEFLEKLKKFEDWIRIADNHIGRKGVKIIWSV